MKENIFKILLVIFGFAFTIIFCITVVPPFLENPDFIGAVSGGFVNPYASAYSMDAISCWMVLFIWILYEASSKSIKHGWICLLIGIFPGVVVGFAAYLYIRTKQLKEKEKLIY